MEESRGENVAKFKVGDKVRLRDNPKVTGEVDSLVYPFCGSGVNYQVRITRSVDQKYREDYVYLFMSVDLEHDDLRLVKAGSLLPKVPESPDYPVTLSPETVLKIAEQVGPHLCPEAFSEGDTVYISSRERIGKVRQVLEHYYDGQPQYAVEVLLPGEGEDSCPSSEIYIIPENNLEGLTVSLSRESAFSLKDEGPFPQVGLSDITAKMLARNADPFPEDLAEVLDEIRDFLVGKNEAYGDSALNPVRAFSKANPIEQLNVRIDDKISRLTRGGDYDGDDDEYDLLGYLVMKQIAKKRGLK